MTAIRQAYLVAAESAGALLATPEVSAAWALPSALTDFSVGGLAAHLATQVLFVPASLDGPAPEEDTVDLPGHYARATWVGADLDADINVAIRQSGENGATAGPAAVVASVEGAITDLRGRLAEVPEDRVVRPAAGRWGLRLDDFLVTRMMEIAVHSDDLAYSVGVPTPELPSTVLDPVFALLASVAVRRHGAVPVLRALSRSERAPAGGISAF